MSPATLSTSLHDWLGAAPLMHQTSLLRLLVALALGVCIGAERQWRQRAAGLRTNTLVCLGAAAFVDLGLTISPPTTQVVAYVVSGVGFLGAGAIMKDGANIRGLNTAATLWCSAAVGACAGSGGLLDAVFVAGLLIAVNSLLRPLSRFIDRHSLATLNLQTIYHLHIVCDTPFLHPTEDLLARSIAERALRLHQIQADTDEEMETSQNKAVIESFSRDDSAVPEIVKLIRKAEGVESVDYTKSEGEAE